jgi:protein gp37
MAKNSGIEWTDHTFNPWWGCVRVSPGCQHCYAETFSKRVGQKVWGVDAPRRFFGDKHWAEPLKWNANAAKLGMRQRVFCASMADVFEDRRDLDAERSRLWMLIESTPRLEWLLLTKRPQNVARLVPSSWMSEGFPVNVRVGTTTEDQERANERIRHLIALPCANFLSVEPLLGRVTFRWAAWDDHAPNARRKRQLPAVERDGTRLAGSVDHLDGLRCIDWLIVGAESGAGARAMDEDWVRTLRDECVEAAVPFFYKQNAINGRAVSLPILDGRQWAEFPCSNDVDGGKHKEIIEHPGDSKKS